MQTQKSRKICLNQEYPCPCRHGAQLQPIALTEAFGCNRCQQIFVVKDEGGVIEQLAAVYPKRFWRWDGHRWLPLSADKTDSQMLMVCLLLMLGSIGLCLALSAGMLLWVALVLSLLTVPALLFLLAYRR